MDGIKVKFNFSAQLFFAEGIDEVIVTINDSSFSRDFRCKIYAPMDTDLVAAQKAIKEMEESFYAAYGKV